MESFSLSLAEIEDILGGRPAREGRFEGTITGIAPLEHAGPCDLTFLGNPRYKARVSSTAAGIVLLPNDFEGAPASGQLYLRLENPSLALASICRRIEGKLHPPILPGIHPSAAVDPSAQIHASASIGPACVIEATARIGPRAVIGAQGFIGRGAEIGEDTRLASGVRVLSGTRVGARCTIDAGAVLGSEGYGYEFDRGHHVKVPQIGRVVIEDDVDIGANTTIDRARFAETRIGQGTKIDNLVQIGHNVRIGRHCLIVAQAGISGSTTLGDYVVLGGQAGLAGHLEIGDGVQIGGQSGVNHDLDAGAKVRGSPAEPFHLATRIMVLQRRLPELFKKVATLEQLIQHRSQRS